MIPVVSVIYCDDIRKEEGGKASYMGVYNTDCKVPNIPTAIPQLCIQVATRLPIERIPKSYELSISIGDNEFPVHKLERNELKNIFQEARKDREEKFVTIAHALINQQFPISKPSKVNVNVSIDGVVYSGNALHIITDNFTPSPSETSREKLSPSIEVEEDKAAPPRRRPLRKL
jgi:hypothetical protein